jgi:hypothetical protein
MFLGIRIDAAGVYSRAAFISIMGKGAASIEGGVYSKSSAYKGQMIVISKASPVDLFNRVH